MDGLTDDAAAATLSSHHGEMVGALHEALDALAASWRSGDTAAWDRKATALYAFLLEDVLPHARGEETTLYAAARAANGALVGSLLDEHEALKSRIDACGAILGAGGRGDPREARLRLLGLAHEVAALFEVHAQKEDHYLVPLVRHGTPPGTLAALFRAMHEPAASN